MLELLEAPSVASVRGLCTTGALFQTRMQRPGEETAHHGREASSFGASAAVGLGIGWTAATALRVESTQIRSTQGFYIRNRNCGFGEIPCIWVLGP